MIARLSTKSIREVFQVGSVMECLKCLPQRVILALMGFLALAIAYSMRACLSVAITEMVIPLNNTGKGNESLICAADTSPTENTTHTKIDGIRYDWNQEIQGYILSSFYIGYFITHIPGGVIAEKYNAKWTLSLGIFIIIIITAVTPFALEFGGHIILILLRILMGLAGGTTLPAVTVLLAAWVPERERGKLGALVLGGTQLGSVFSFYISGLILSHWPYPVVFYFWSGIGFLWFIIFTIICYSNPGDHPFISSEERDYLRNELGQIKRNNDLPPTPWKSILTNVPVLALTFGQICHDWLFYIMASDLPKYMKEVLGFSVHDVGLYSSLPYLLMWAVSVGSGFLSDYLTGHEYLSITQARKIFTGLASVFPSVFILIASYSGCNRLLVVVSFILAMGFMGNFYPGMKVNCLDLSPNYSGSLMGLTNGLGALTGIAAPAFVGIMTPDSSLDQWRFVFWITFGIAMIRTVVFTIWASGKVQPFNHYDPVEQNTPETIKLADEKSNNQFEEISH